MHRLFQEISIRQCNFAFATLLFAVFCTMGCATAIGVRHVDTQESQELLTANVLSSGTPSADSLQMLSRQDLLKQFSDDPEAALATLHAQLQSTKSARGIDNRLFALAELSFLHAEQRKKRGTGLNPFCHTQPGRKCAAPSYSEKAQDRTYYLAAAVYAYAYMFPEDRPGITLDPSDPRSHLIYDLYNRGLAEGLSSPGGQEVVLASGRHTLPFGTLDIEFVSADFSWGGYGVEHFVPAANLDVRGLRDRYRRPGIGASLAASLDRTREAEVVGASRIPARLKVPVTAFLRLDAPRHSLTSGSLQGKLELYAPNQAKIVVNGKEQSLEFEPSVALAYTLEGSPLYDFEIAGFLRDALRTAIPQDRAQDGLFMLLPPRRDRIPVVLVHGTASSPARWADLVNELGNDPQLRAHYQVWLFIYDTGNPIGYSGGRLREALQNVMHELDPEGKAPALQQMVVMGHSQGGLLTKLTAIDSGNRFWDNISKTPFDELKMAPETRELLRRSIFFTPLPFVKSVVFIATPQRGSYMAAGRLAHLAGWMVSLPGNLSQQSLAALAQDQDNLLIQKMKKLPTAIDNMTPSNPFITTLATIPIAPGVTAHSIIAVQGNGPPEEGGDGIVKYKSAHIEGVESELVVRSAHSCQANPNTIGEVRRILREHLGTQKGS